MDPSKNFTDEDRKKVVEFLNTVALYATFNVNTDELIKYFGLLSYMQRTIIPKIDKHVLEVKQVIEAKPEPTESENGQGE